jgi:flagellar basal-body rod protein FlgB
MPLQLEAVTTTALSAALDAASRRHAVAAANIANANSDGYVPLRLSFEAQLAEARAILRDRGVLDGAALDHLRSLPDMAADTGGSAERVQLDMEMAEIARNAVHFQALAQGLSRHLSILALAAADGRK